MICINDEDYNRIRHKGAKAASYHLVPGIGVDSRRFKCVSTRQRDALRIKHNVSKGAFVAAYAAEFIHRKNHKMIVDAVERLKDKIPGILVLLAGRGELLESTQADVARRGLDRHIRFVGFVENVEEYYQLADLAISTSRQEGLGLNLVEAMMCGCPVVATIDRGHRTVLDSGLGGILTPQEDASAFADAVLAIHNDDDARSRMRSEAMVRASGFELSKALSAIGGIYTHYLENAK